MVELQVNSAPSSTTQQVPGWLLITFTVCTTLLVSVHMLALMISTCILPNVDEIAEMKGIVAVSVPRLSMINLTGIIFHSQVTESPHIKMRIYIETAWAFSTVFGIFLFLIELAILCWVKFWDIGYTDNKSGQKAALVATMLLIPIGILFIGFAIHFYRSLVSHKFERSDKNLHDLEFIMEQLSHQRVPLNGEQSNQVEVV